MTTERPNDNDRYHDYIWTAECQGCGQTKPPHLEGCEDFGMNWPAFSTEATKAAGDDCKNEVCVAREAFYQLTLKERNYERLRSNRMERERNEALTQQAPSTGLEALRETATAAVEVFFADDKDEGELTAVMMMLQTDVTDVALSDAPKAGGDVARNTITFNEDGHRVHGTATIRQLTMSAAHVHLKHLDDNVYMLIVENAERYVYVKLTARSSRGKIDGWIYEESEQEYPERFQQPPSTGVEALKAAQRGLTAYKYGHDILLRQDVSDLRETEANEIGTEALEIVNAAIEATLTSDALPTEQPMCSAEGIVAAHPACEPADAPTTSERYQRLAKRVLANDFTEDDLQQVLAPPTEPVCGIRYKPRAEIDYWKWCKLEKDHAGLHGQERFQPTTGGEGK